MLTTLWALGGLIGPMLYLIVMIVVWACVKERSVRTVLLLAMALWPVWIGVNLAVKYRDAHAAESQFNSLCAAQGKPVIHGTAQGVNSIFIDQRSPQGIASDLAPKANAVLPYEELRPLMLQGASRYSLIEQQSDRMTLRTDVAGPRRPISPGLPASLHKLEWKSLEQAAPHVLKGTLAVKATDRESPLAEISLIRLDIPAVTLFGDNRLALRLADPQTRSCPGIREITRIVKSVARPDMTGVR